MVDGAVSGWTICDTNIVFLQDFPCFFALQETDSWTISAMDVPGHIVYGRDLGRTPIFCVHGRLVIFVARGSTMRDAPSFWWVR